jgi:hypothetical protein
LSGIPDQSHTLALCKPACACSCLHAEALEATNVRRVDSDEAKPLVPATGERHAERVSLHDAVDNGTNVEATVPGGRPAWRSCGKRGDRTERQKRQDRNRNERAFQARTAAGSP